MDKSTFPNTLVFTSFEYKYVDIRIYIRIFSPYLISKNMNHVTVFFIDKNDLRAHNLFQITPVFRTTAMKLNNFIIYEVFGGI